MKRILVSLLALLLVATMLFACTKKVVDNPPDDGTDDTDDQTTSLDPTDAGTYMKDALGVYVNGTTQVGVDFLPQSDFASASASAKVSSAILSSLVDADTIIAQGHADVPVYGIYAGAAHEYLNFYGDLDAIGITALRTNLDHNVNDTVMEAFCSSNISVMITAGVSFSGGGYYTGPAEKLETDPELVNLDNYNFTGYLEAVVTHVQDFLKQYGPEGTFFDTYTGNYNPIRYIEVQNEPNFQYLMAIKRAGGADAANHYIKSCIYALEQIISYSAIKSLCPDDEYGNPTVYVVGMGAGGVSGLDLAFLQQVLSMDNSTVFQASSAMTSNKTLYEILNESIAASELLQEVTGVDGVNTKLDIDTISTMDIMSTHPYIDGKSGATSPFGGTEYYSVTANIATIRNLLATKGAEDLPIWFTECGWNISKEEGALKEGAGPHTQLEQAEMEVQYYLYAIRNGIDRITYMSIIDTDGCNYGQFQAESSSLGSGGSTNTWIDADWRLCCYAIQNMISLLPNPALTRVIQESCAQNSDGVLECILIYELEPDIGSRDRVTVALSPLAATTIDVPWDADYAVVTDLFGARQLVAAVGGAITIQGGPSLIYLQEPTMLDLIEFGVNPTARTAADLQVAWLGEKYEF